VRRNLAETVAGRRPTEHAIPSPSAWPIGPIIGSPRHRLEPISRPGRLR
jgi:hypothetical protein